MQRFHETKKSFWGYRHFKYMYSDNISLRFLKKWHNISCTRMFLCIRAKWPIRPELYSFFSSMKRLGVFLLPPGWDASPSQGYLQHQIFRYPYTVRVKCLAQEHNTMSPARARTRNARSGVERTNHEATAPPL